MEDSVCQHETKIMFSIKNTELNSARKKQYTSCKMFQIDISCRFGSSCAYLNFDHSA